MEYSGTWVLLILSLIAATYEKSELSQPAQCRSGGKTGVKYTLSTFPVSATGKPSPSVLYGVTVRNNTPFTHFFFVFPSFHALTHIILS
jgi:hypothetical protein